MAITKTINIDGKDVRFRASAAIPRMYRNCFGRDIYRDLRELQDAGDDDPSGVNDRVLELFEDISYIMAKHADPDGVPDTAEEWLSGFGIFSVYRAMPEIIGLWGMNVRSLEESKKN